METYPNPTEQERQAKLSLLNLDDDNENEDQREVFDQTENWGRSLETQKYLREKLSQRYRTKRRSNRELRSVSTANKEYKLKRPVINDKQSLKDLLKKLESKELKPSNVETIKNSMIVDFKRSSKDRVWALKNQSNRSTIDEKNIDNRSLRRRLKQMSQNEQNNFYSKKVQLINSKRQNFDQNTPLLSLQNCGAQNQGITSGYEFVKRRDFLTESKIEKRRKGIFRKNTQNKENEILSFLEFPLDPYRKEDFIKNSVLIMKNDKYRTNSIQKEEINKRTFHILQQINRTKSINNVKKLTSQSLKLKKPQMCAYSKAFKDKSNLMEQQYRSKQNILIKSSHDSVWVKLEIRK